MTKPRVEWTNERQLTRALLLERRAMRALVGRLIMHHMPYEQVRLLCGKLGGDVVRTGALFQEQPGLLPLTCHALESVGLLIDEMTEETQ